MLDPRASPSPDDDSTRHLLERLLVQLNLVEVLYLRLVRIQARRLAHPEQEELKAEAVRTEDELRIAQAELEELGVRAKGEHVRATVLPPRRTPGF